MLIRTDPHTVRAIASQIARPAEALPSAAAVRPIVAQARKAGSFSMAETEDALWTLNAHVGGLTSTAGLLALADARPEYLYAQPRGRRGETWGHERVTAADLAGLLILLERLGLDVDPDPLVLAIGPDLADKPFLTQAELAVRWYGARRHAGSPVEITTDAAATRSAAFETVTRPNGYQAQVWPDAEGRAVALVATAPRWRPAARRAA